jgi:hypothetical protein
MPHAVRYRFVLDHTVPFVPEEDHGHFCVDAYECRDICNHSSELREQLDDCSFPAFWSSEDVTEGFSVVTVVTVSHLQSSVMMNEMRNDVETQTFKHVISFL